jgi:hypothetical protein
LRPASPITLRRLVGPGTSATAAAFFGAWTPVALRTLCGRGRCRFLLGGLRGRRSCLLRRRRFEIFNCWLNCYGLHFVWHCFPFITGRTSLG